MILYTYSNICRLHSFARTPWWSCLTSKNINWSNFEEHLYNCLDTILITVHAFTRIMIHVIHFLSVCFVQIAATAAAAALKESDWAPRWGRFLVPMSLTRPAAPKNSVRRHHFSSFLALPLSTWERPSHLFSSICPSLTPRPTSSYIYRLDDQFSCRACISCCRCNPLIH